MAENSREQIWPALDYSEWRETCATLQLWTQIVGKIRLALGPWINHSWGVTLYVTVRGLTTSLIPYGSRAFEIEFDFTRHELRIITAEGDERVITLQPQSVANFYRQVMANLRELGVEVQIGMKPNETLEAIPFDHDEKHAAYDLEYANRFWRVLLQADRVFKEFRSRFCGKCSPVHFFWGSFRSGGDAFLRKAGATTSRWHSPFTGCNHTRSLFAGGEQPRILARQRSGSHGAVLFLCLSFARWFRGGKGETGRRIFSSADARVRPPL